MKDKYLSIWGVEPIYLFTISIITFIITTLELVNKIPSYKLFSPIISTLIGTALIIAGLILWISAVVFK